MTITVNGDEQNFDEQLNLAQLLAQLKYAHKKVAVAVNTTFIPRAHYETILLKDGDEIEIVAPQQGG